MIRKRLVSLFLAVVMLCSLSMTAFAASDEDVAMSAEQGIIASETFEIPVSFNQRARDSSSLERTKIPRRIARFLVGFSFFWRSAHLCTLFAHRRESRVFPCIVCILCIVSEFSIVFQANSSRVNSRRCSGFICRTTVSITSGVI